MASFTNYKEPLLADDNDDEDDEEEPVLHLQPSYRILATEFRTLLQKKSDNAFSAITDVSSFVPNKKTSLIQFEYEVHEKTVNIKYRIVYMTAILLFIIFYILLFFESTLEIAQYMTLILSLLLSLLYTLLPSCVKIPFPISCVNVENTDLEAEYDKKLQMVNVLCTKKRIPLEQWTVPPLCVILLVASTKFSYKSAWMAVVGVDYPNGILPWNVLGVLFGLCYLCITLDLTGILKALATKTSLSAEPYPLKLFVYIFIFAAVLTCVTNNDISIICLTPLVINTAKESNMDPDPFIFLVLFASNTFSMLLVTGNPANLIVEASAGLKYTSYAKIMALPTIITGLALLLELYVMFGNKLKTTYHCKGKHDDWKRLIKLPKYAVFCALRLCIACVLLLVVTFIPSIEEITGHDMFVVLGIAVISLIIDLCVFDLRRCATLVSEEGLIRAAKLSSHPVHNEEEEHHDHPLNSLLDHETQTVDVELSSVNANQCTEQKEEDKYHDYMQTRVIHDSVKTYDSNHLLYDKRKRERLKVMSFGIDALWELPWGLIPFVLSLFILVQFMNDIGLVSKLSDVLLSISNDNQWIAMFVVGGLATVLCQCVNNQPMTVLLSTVLSQTKKNNESFSLCCSDGAYFALAVGANLGGNATPIASLAVLMWKSILEKWGLSISYVGFSKKGIPITPLLVVLCIVVVGIELKFFTPNI